MDIVNLLLFCVAVVGMTHILVDSTIFEPIRNFFRERVPVIGKMMGCYQCSGFWCGLFLGLTILSYNVWIVFAAGCAGSFLATLGANYLTKLEAEAMVTVGEPPVEEPTEEEEDA